MAKRSVTDAYRHHSIAYIKLWQERKWWRSMFPVSLDPKIFSRMRLTAWSHLQSFDDRLERLERMFNDFLTNVHSSARPVVSRGRPASPSPSRRRSLDESINTSEAGKRKSNHCETFQSEQNEAEPCRKRRRFELRLNQERTYADPFGELYSDERGEFR